METKPPSEISGCYNNFKDNDGKNADDISLKIEKKINVLALNKMSSNKAIIFGHLVQASSPDATVPFKYKLKKRKKKKKKKKNFN